MIVVRDIAYVRYQVEDLDAQDKFLRDFGLRPYARSATSLQMATYNGGYPAYIAARGPKKALGVGYRVDSVKDLQRIAAHFKFDVCRNDEIGGGWILTLQDPDGFRVDLLHGGEVVAPEPVRSTMTLNTADQRRRLG